MNGICTEKGESSSMWVRRLVIGLSLGIWAYFISSFVFGALVGVAVASSCDSAYEDCDEQLGTAIGAALLVSFFFSIAVMMVGMIKGPSWWDQE
jgi:hypothetical protein